MYMRLCEYSEGGKTKNIKLFTQSNGSYSENYNLTPERSMSLLYSYERYIRYNV